MDYTILQCTNSQKGEYSGQDIINAIIDGFEKKLDFSLLEIVLDDCPQYPEKEKNELIGILNAISARFNENDINHLEIRIEDDMVYHMETENGKDIPNPILEEMGYKQIIFTILCEMKIKSLKLGAELAAGLSIYYLIDDKNNLTKLTCDNRFTED